MSEHDESINQFREVTGTDEQRARFYLESSGWQLETALASFYENDGMAVDRQAGDGEDEPVEVPSNPNAAPTSRTTEPRQAAVAAAHKLQSQMSSSDSDSDEGQAFYVGGSERSGQQVIGPPRQKSKPSGDLVGDMFKSAREHGAEVLEKGSSSSRKTTLFKGTGYRLGQNETDTQVIPGQREPEPPRTVVLKLWKSGFSLDEGAVREYQNPANKEFLDYIKRGEVPMELIREARGREVHLQMEDHRTEEFISKRSRFQAFGGEGQMLGNPAPSVSQVPVAAPADLKTCEQTASDELKVATSEPITNVQIRLADGSRLIGRFNHTHTVGQVRQYILTARPQYSLQPFALLTTYPSQELKDDQATLKDASLLGATIMQRMK